MSEDKERLDFDIACLNPETLHATLVSSVGSHCDVWRTNKRFREADPNRTYHEFVIKYPNSRYSWPEIRILKRDYVRLKTALEEIIPSAEFFITQMGGQENVCVIADAVDIWFNIANPQNREEAIELLSASVRGRDQLRRFIEASRQWYREANSRLIDLYGLDNLVMDKNYEIRYIDSFFVFFYEDMLDIVDENSADMADSRLRNQIDTSLQRLTYLEEILQISVQ